jgi:biotin synthase
MKIRSDWTKEEIRAIHDRPLLGLIYQAASVHREHHPANQVQVCSLISIKTGGCPEDCKYCPQSARYQTNVTATPLMQEEEILAQARQAIANGATRVCLGAAWRTVRESAQFEQILRVIQNITAMGVEVCCTLGMLTEPQAVRLKEAGLHAYNHNLDTSPEFYSSIITTRRYEDRLRTLDAVEKAGISVCCGGIIGMGESVDDRVGLLHALATRNPHPESVPINLLIPVPGTPLAQQKPVPIWEMIRMVATARITMPEAMVRLSAGRLERSLEEQALCFLAGANSIFSGEKLLTRPNPDFDADEQMFRLFGLTPLPACASV